MSLSCLTCGRPFPATTFGASVPPASGSSLVWWGVGLFSLLCVVAMGGAGVLILGARGFFDDEPTKDTKPTVAAPVVVTSTPPIASSVAVVTKTVAPLTDEERDELPGNYTCSLDDTPSFRCRIANNVLEKLEGSQRFRGPVTRLGNGNIGFSGTFFCPFGDCTHPVATTFVRQGPGRYVGRFGPNRVPGGGPGGERIVLTKVR